MTPLTVFEELRFIMELLIAELAFILPTAKKRDAFLLRAILGASACICASFGYFLLAKIANKPTYLTITIYISWYILLTTLTFFYLKACFKINFSQAVLYGTVGYCISHLEYAVVNEAFALGIFPKIRNYLIPYIIISLFTYALMILLFYAFFIRKFLTIENGIKMPSKSKRDHLAIYILFVSLCVITFSCQAFFHNGEVSSLDFMPNYLAPVVEVFTCTVFIILIYVLCSENTVQKDYEMISQLLHESAKQYAIKKETIELVNAKCHDMKHQISALKHLDNEDRNKSLEELEKNIMIYDVNIDTGNEVLNTLLMEKQLLCVNQNIRFSFTGDGKIIDFMDPVTLYSLLGNLLDNALESVSKLDNNNKKSIELIITKANNNILIRTNNYFDRLDVDSNGNIKTSKIDEKYHGYGLKSIKRIAKSYGGSFVTDSNGDIFNATVIIPSK